jgi:DNA-directed RNA polymerase specialized sigma24 family protein
MTAKEYLSQARDITLRLGAMAEQLAFLKSAAMYAAPQFVAAGKCAARNIHANEDAVVRALDYERRMGEEHGKLAEISNTLDRLPDPLQRAVLVKRYISGKTWREVAAEMNYSECTVYRLHIAGLEQVDVFLKS